MPEQGSSVCDGGALGASTRSGPQQAVAVRQWCCVWLAVALLVGAAAAGPAAPRATPPKHHLTKRSFFDIQCKGVYDKSIFARLDRICEDCYNLFREPQLHSLCRKNCFTTDYFKGCLEALQLTDEMTQIQTWIKQLHGAEPGV